MYTSRFIILIAFTFCFFHTSAQEISAEIHGKQMKDFISLEKKLGSHLFQGNGDIIITPGGMATPLLYRRTENGIPDLIVTYTFSIKDSLVNNIGYEWDIANFDKEYKKQPLKVQKAFIKKYEFLKDQLSHKYGKGEQRGDLSDLTKIELKDGLASSGQWNPNDSTEVYLYGTFQNYQGKNGTIEIEPSYCIRVSVQEVKKVYYPESSAEAIKAAKKSYEQFIIKLRAGDFEGAKAFFSSQLRNQVTETAFNKIKELIKPEPFEVYMKGIQNIKGTNYLLIQYAYVGSPEAPNEVIRVLFDKENLIIGIQPFSRKAKTN